MQIESGQIATVEIYYEIIYFFYWCLLASARQFYGDAVAIDG